MKRPSNMEFLGGDFYIVRTQAGFKKAIRHFNDGDLLKTEKIRGYPRTYPSLVSFSHGYQGDNFILANCIGSNHVLEAIRKSDEDFRQSQETK